MNDRQRRLDAVFRSGSELETDTIDHFFRGAIDRRQFMARASVLGMSGGLVAFLVACSSSDESKSNATSMAGAGKKGGTIKVGSVTDSTSIDPVTLVNLGGLIVLYQIGDYLTFDGPDLVLRPGIAEKWTPNTEGTEWTFTLRNGVKFHDGADLTAADVVATFDRLADPDQKSNALSVFKDVLTKGNVTASDPRTVLFKLDAPNGNFPYLVSSDNYNAIILPRNHTFDDAHLVATGPWKLESFTPKQGATFVRNEAYWGTKPSFDRAEFTFFADAASQVQALQSGAIDVAHQVAASDAKPLASSFIATAIPTAAHRQLHMRTDLNPFKDKRTRQAVALVLDRPAIITGLLDGKADLGNDSPFAPAYPTTDKSVAQRAKDLAKAKQLLQATGQDDGFKVQLNAVKVGEVPDYATLVQQAVKDIGVTVTTVVQESGEFYGDAVFGKSPWLDAVAGVVDYGHRGVPNVFLGAPLVSDGTWNSAHFKNPQYDRLVKQFFAALDVESGKKVAKQIQEMLLDETPVVVSYFFQTASYAKKEISGYTITGTGQIDLTKAVRA